MELALCNGCRRHVRTDESACPFCGGEIGAVARPSRAGLPPRYVALFGLALGACAQGAYGGPPDIPSPRDTGAETRATEDPLMDDDLAEPGDAGIADDAVYGEPPVDGGN